MSTYRPLVSVIIPSSNHGKYIKECLNSVLSQTYNSLEVIVVDNFSTDTTDDVLKSIHDPRLRILKIDNGGVIGISRNRGIENARGDWLAFLDSDDYWEPDKLTACVTHLSHADFIYHDMKISIQTNDQNQFIRSRNLVFPILLDLLMNGNTIVTSSVLAKKSILLSVGGFDESLEMVGFEDYNLWLKMALVTNSFKHIPKILGHYRKHDLNTSRHLRHVVPWVAINNFLFVLSPKQKKKLEGKLRYVKLKSEILDGHPINIEDDLLAILASQNFELICKSLAMYFFYRYPRLGRNLMRLWK
jgi:glycosyltransferase involved in cell wall biosynthesis